MNSCIQGLTHGEGEVDVVVVGGGRDVVDSVDEVVGRGVDVGPRVLVVG